MRPHLIGIDDGPFDKDADAVTPIVGVVMEGPDLVEGVAVTRFPIDGSGVTDFLAAWIAGLRFLPGLQGVEARFAKFVTNALELHGRSSQRGMGRG